jgi:hypothetical protein
MQLWPCGVERDFNALPPQYLTLSVVESTDNEQTVGKLDVLLQYLALLLSNGNDNKERSLNSSNSMASHWGHTNFPKICNVKWMVTGKFIRYL